MPRVTLSKKKYLMQDLSDYISCEMKRQKITQKQMCEKLGMEQGTFSKHLKDLKASELIVIFHELGTDKEKIGRLLNYD